MALRSFGYGEKQKQHKHIKFTGPLIKGANGELVAGAIGGKW